MQMLGRLHKSKKPHYTPVNVELVHSPEASSSGAKTWSRFHHGWRFTVATGACLSFVVLWINVGLLLWAQNKDASSNNIITLFQGSCAVRERTVTLWHLAINVLSTLLLGASTACVQVLGSPTREEIDSWHSRGAWLDIGVLSWRNFKRIPRWRLGLMLVLGLSSIPLHLVYNSIIYAIMPLCNHTSPWPASLNDGGKGTADACSRKNYEGQAPNSTQLQQLQLNLASLERLENADCIKTFQGGPYEPEYRGVVLVSNVTNSRDSVLQFLDTNFVSGKANALWMCENDWAHSPESTAVEIFGASLDPEDSTVVGGPSSSCSLDSLTSNPSGWQMFDPSAADSSSLLTIEYCLAERSKFQECTIEFSKALMLVVIVFNSVKTICFILALKICTSPLITVGDAVASFLEHPDPTTRGFGTHSVKNIKNYRAWKALRHQQPDASMIAPPPPVPNRWEAPKRRLWHESVSVWREIWTFGLCCIFWWVPVTLFLADDENRQDFGSGLQKAGFGSINSSYLLAASLGKPLTIDILLANAPQLAMSIVYGFYNSYLTSIIQSAEYLRFATHRRTLRVSVPVGLQRSTYWLNIPYSYAVPMMVAMALLHWLISQSLFLARTYVWDYNYAIDPQFSITGTGWSSLAVILTLILGLFMILGLFLISRSKTYPTNMPLAGSNSAAISAACHRQETEASDMVQRPLKYGVLSSADREGRKRVGFSAEEVEPLVSGELYV